MAAHRADARALAPDIAAHQQQVDQHPHAVAAMDVLGQPHSVNADHAFRPSIEFRHLDQVGPRQAAGGLDTVPGQIADPCLERHEVVAMLRNEIAVQGPPVEQVLADARDGRDVAAGTQLQIQVGNRRRAARQHFRRILGVHKFDQAAFAHRVEGHDLAAPLHGLLNGVQETRAVRPGVLAKEQHQVAMFEILQHAGADRRADGALQRDAGRLVAHIGTVGQVVVAVKPRKQGIKIRCLKACLARRIKDRRFRIQPLQRLPDGGEGLSPGGADVTVAGRVIAQGMGQAAHRLQVVIAPVAQFRQRMFGKEIRPAALGRKIPDGGLGAVLAELGQVGGRRLGPGAG